MRKMMETGLTLARFLRHPTWGVRHVRNRVRDAILWRRQGRPTSVPVVVRSGELLIRPDGQRVIRFWHWSMTYMDGPLYLQTEDDVDRLWEALLPFAEPRWTNAA